MTIILIDPFGSRYRYRPRPTLRRKENGLLLWETLRGRPGALANVPKLCKS